MIRCPNGCDPDYFEAYVEGACNSVIVTPDGRATNRWSDGTVGVPRLARVEAEEDDAPLCACCGEHAYRDA